ncbi:MAG: hypothetical protein JO142_04100 [Burkholderiales bacterium]|nr:hypothetical protein [Burkholderiales bacterium]
MLIEDLSKYLYEDLNGQVDSIAQGNRGLLITLECDDWEIHGGRRRFLLVCADVRECTLTVGPVGWVKFFTEHPVLLEHNSEHSELMFSSAPGNSYEVIGRLQEAHGKVYGHWRLLSEHLNANHEILSGGHGLVARGPHLVMQKYAAAIDSLLKVNIVHSYKPKTEFRALVFDEQFLVCNYVDVIEI